MLMIALSILAILSQDSFSEAQLAAIAHDRKAFEPYRQCILKESRALYPQGADFTTIYQAAQNACAGDAALVAADFALAAMDRSMAPDQDYGMHPMTLFMDELILEIGKEFFPKAAHNAPNH